MECPISLEKIPLGALRNATRSLISNLLNPIKVLPSPSKYPRDFRGLAYLSNLPLPPCNCHDPTATVLKSWESLSNPSVAEFISALELIDRWDVIDDIQDLLGKDVLEFSKGAAALQTPNVSPNLESDKHILTVDDVLRIEKGLEPQFYDAFLLYSDDDVEFASQMIDRLEQQYHFKLCIKDRDLVGGVTFEHEAIMRLISERCKRVIIIISPSFIESPANRFFVNYSQALGIDACERKIIPCVYKHVAQLPRELTYYFRLDYNRTSPLWNFWDKLSSSIKAPLPGETSTRAEVQASVKITELPEDPSKWECPKKSSQPLPLLPAIKARATSPCRSQSATASPKLAHDPEAVSHKGGVENVEPRNHESKSKTFSLTSLLPSPPSEKLKKMKWWKNKKKMVVAEPPL